MDSEEFRLKEIHKAIIKFDKRAERSSEEVLVATFVDSEPLLDLLSTRNNQVIYGRRGTGKTHALKYLADKVASGGDLPIYLDLRSAGSNGSVYGDSTRSLAERAATLIIDVLGALKDELFRIAVERIDKAPHPEAVTIRLDDLSEAISRFKVEGSAEQEHRIVNAGQSTTSAAAEINPAKQSAGLKLEAARSEKSEAEVKTTKAGRELISLNFGSVMSSLTGLLAILGSSRVWLLIDEWSEVPLDLQPYLADLVRRTILPVGSITVKIAAIEHRTNFTIAKERGEYIGIELGADMAADLNLDDFLVFENNQHKATSFFANLIYKHYVSIADTSFSIASANQFVQTIFTQWPVFEEFVRAVEGVPRDALNLAATLATKAFGRKIAMPDVRLAARDWYQQDKASVVRGNPELSTLLEHIIDEVIGNRKARAFLFLSNQREASIDALFDARLLHVLKKSISSHDEPGRRYDVYKIDYGCYVDQINTSRAPMGLYEIEDEGFVDVPRDDYRSIRRAILRMSDIAGREK